MEGRWWPEIQLTEQRPGPEAACCIGFGVRTLGFGGKKLPHLAGWPALMRQGDGGGGDRYATNEGWMNKLMGSWKSSQPEQLSLICAL